MGQRAPGDNRLRLYEYQAKEILNENNLKVPRGGIAYSPNEARDISKNLVVPGVVKAQVLVGGRGLAGGIKFANDPDEVHRLSSQLLGSTLKKQDVDCVLIEEKVDIEEEFYLGVTIDYNRKSPVVIASYQGGVDIEKTAVEHPESVVKENVDSLLGLTDFQARRIAKKIGLTGRDMRSFSAYILSLFRIMHRYDASLVEINPLVYSSEKQFVAADAKIILDDNAFFRNRELQTRFQSGKEMPEEEGIELRKAQIERAEIPTYIELDGNMGIISDGAGTGMLTFDLTRDCGGAIGVYCELGGKATPALIEEAMKIVLSNREIEVLLINLIGGLNRMDEMAEGITAYISKKTSDEGAVIVVRMSGTLEDKGRDILNSSGVTSYDNIYEAIEKAVEVAGGN
jgi:succinyl-CoA synthetase beta subunit